jgi:hypothetical protein
MTLSYAFKNGADFIEQSTSGRNFVKGDPFKLHDAMQKVCAIIEINTLAKGTESSQSASVGQHTSNVSKPGNSGQTR